MKVSYNGSEAVHKDVYRNLMYAGNKYSFKGENYFDNAVGRCTENKSFTPYSDYDHNLTVATYDDGSTKSVLLEGSINYDTLVNSGIIPSKVLSKSRLLGASLDNIKSIKFGDPVTNIEEDALVNSSIQSVNFNNSSITDGSLKGCSSLYEMSLNNPDYYVNNGILFHKGSSYDEILLVDNNVIDLDLTQVSGLINLYCYSNCFNLRTIIFNNVGAIDVIHVFPGTTVTVPNTPTREITGVRNGVVLINRTGSDIDLNTIPMTGVSEVGYAGEIRNGDVIRTKELRNSGKYATYDFYKCIDPKKTGFNAHDWNCTPALLNMLSEKKVKFLNNSWAYFAMHPTRPNNDDVVMSF